MNTDTQDASKTHKLVSITIDDKKFEVHPGKHRVSELKKLGNVPAGDELAQLIDGKLITLADDADVEIEGGEIFVSHPKKGHSS